MEKKKIDIILSIIIPVYKVECYLLNCFESLNQQIEDAIEIIFVDDGSPDNSGKLCDDYALGKKNVKVIHKMNGGLSDARNAGINVATGEYCMFLDSDDTITKDACKTVIGYLENLNVDILYLDVHWICQKKIITYGKRGFATNCVMTGAQALTAELETEKYAAMAQLGIYRRIFLKENDLYFKKGILHEDEEWSPRVMMRAEHIIRKDYVFYNYFIHENSITQNKNLKRYTDLIDTIYELNSIYSNSKNTKIRRFGGQYLAKLYMSAIANLNEAGEKKKKDKKFLVNNTHGIKNWIRLLLFWGSSKLYLKILGQ